MMGWGSDQPKHGSMLEQGAEQYNAQRRSLSPAAEIHVFGFIDWSLSGPMVVAQALNSTRTGEFLRPPGSSVLGELPTEPVKNKAGSATEKAGMSPTGVLPGVR
jgi:hypothetical protein